MSVKSNIEWTDATWNVLAGCSKVSAGCHHCYAIPHAHRMAGNPNPKIAEKYAGTTTTDGKNWTGRINLAENLLDWPMRLRKPSRIFVNAMSDLFHEEVSDDSLDRIFAIMALCPRHTFKVLTKRPERMADYMHEIYAGRMYEIAESRLNDSAQRILAAFERLGVFQVRRVNAAFFAGYTENGHFNNIVGSLNVAGLVSYPQGGFLSLTDEGRALARADAHKVGSLEELHATWLAKLKEPQARLLRVLLDIYPRDISRDDLAARTGYTVNGHFNNTVGSLRTLGAADYPRVNYVAATDVLFPKGLD